MKYRVGRKQKRVVLDENGLEVRTFREGKEKEAQEYCDYLNDFQGYIDKRLLSDEDIQKLVEPYCMVNTGFITKVDFSAVEYMMQGYKLALAPR